jgi:hypothetical protein
MIIRCLVLLGLLAALPSLSVAREPGSGESWISYRNERFGFSFRYPADVFSRETASEAGDGEMLVAKGGEARLLVGALVNEERQSPASYLDHVAKTSYADYTISYRRIRSTWFALSGEGNGKTFYEKVMFGCGGAIINSFAVVYPSEQAALYDRIVEGIEASFRPGRSCEGRTAGNRDHVVPAPQQGPQVPRGPRSELADRIARQRGHDVIVVLRRSSPPYDYKTVRGYVSR